MKPAFFIILILAITGEEYSIAFPQSAPCEFDSTIWAAIQHVSKDSIAVHIKNLSIANRYYSRTSYTPGNKWAARYIFDYFQKLPAIHQVVMDSFFVYGAKAPYDTIPLVNIVATFQGKRDTNQYIIIGGHFDATANRDPNYNWDDDWSTAMAPGSDDNATGVAAMLEIARVLSQRFQKNPNNITLKLIAFGAEEKHPAYFNSNHLGSRRYAWKAFNRGDRILCAFILDMIGYNQDTLHFSIVSDSASAAFGRRALEINHCYAINLHTDGAPFPEATYSDHESFWLYGYRAILIIENAPPWNDHPPWYSSNPHYHKQSDTPDKINMEQVARIAQLTLGTALSLEKAVTAFSASESNMMLPQIPKLLPNAPNPFNNGTWIRFALPRAAELQIEIFDIHGRVIQRLYHAKASAGYHSVYWNGTDRFNHAVSSGVYLYRLIGQDFILTRKMILIR